MSNDAPTAATNPSEPQSKIRVSRFVYMIIAAILIYCGSGGPAIYLVMVAHRQLNQPNWIQTTFFIIYRPHLDLCYRQEPYFQYLNWFIVKAGERARTHAEFKEDWAVQGGYKQPSSR